MVLWERILSSEVGIRVSDSLFRLDVCDCLFASKHPGWWAHINSFLTFLEYLGSSHWNSAGNWRQSRRKRSFVNNWLSEQRCYKLLKEWLGITPKKEKYTFISEKWLTPSHVELSLPRSNDSLHFSQFSSSKEKKHRSLWSQICFRMGNENIFPWKLKAKYFETFSAHFLKSKLNTALLWAMLAPAHFSGSNGCRWSFQP